MAKVWVNDIECLYDFFCATFVDRDSDEKRHFRIWDEINQTLELCEFLRNECAGLIGFNNINYDWPIENYILVARNKLARLDGAQAARLISAKSQEILSQTYSAIREPSIPQLDLYRVHHFDNKNKAVSLKALQIAMNWPLVADMPVHHTEFSQGEDWANQVEEYNTNDVLSTKHFLQKSERDIALRKRMTELYGLDMLNFNEPKMGEYIILSQVAKTMNTPFYIVKESNTRRDKVALGNCMLPIEFESKEFKGAKAAFQAKVVDTRIREPWEEKKKKDEEDLYSCIFDGTQYDFGLGGIHGLKGPGIYKEDENNVIISADVKLAS